MYFHFKKNKDVKNGLHYVKPDGAVRKGIYSIGLPAMIAQALMSVMTYAWNGKQIQGESWSKIWYTIYTGYHDMRNGAFGSGSRCVFQNLRIIR